MPNEAVQRSVEYAKKRFEEYSRALQEQQRSRQMFESCEPGGRQYVSPLGGEAEFPWGRKGKE
jgi:hypothetical protein